MYPIYTEMDNKKTRKNAENFECLSCNFKCCKESEWTRHISTLKHQRITEGYIKNAEKFVCDCGKQYSYSSGLSKHKKKCTYVVDDRSIKNKPKEVEESTAIVQILNENKELQKIVMEQSKQISEQSKQISQLIPKVGNNNSYNNTNKFNINVFLNETCKNAMSITDFTNSIQLQLEDLMYSKENGTIEGLSNIIVKGLNELDVERRPVHCTDAKRETLYIKDSEGWEKENKDQEKMKKMITTTQRKHGKLLIDWQEQHPNWQDSDALTDEFHELVQRLTFKDGGENKIIKNIAKEVVVVKD